MHEETNVKNRFLGKLKHDKTPATVFMKNGFQMHGTIADFDRYAVILNESGDEKLLYQGAISTIAPHYPPRQHYTEAAYGNAQ